jgi:hypothetical protein
MSIFDDLTFKVPPVMTATFYPMDRKPDMSSSCGVIFMWEDDRDGYTYRMYAEIRVYNGFVVAPKDFRNPPVAYAIMVMSDDFDLEETDGQD